MREANLSTAFLFWGTFILAVLAMSLAGVAELFLEGDALLRSRVVGAYGIAFLAMAWAQVAHARLEDLEEGGDP